MSQDRRKKQGSMTIGGEVVEPGERQEVEFQVARLPTRTRLSIPVVVIRGEREGPCVWLSAAIHGDELNGIEIVRRTLMDINPKTLHGTLLAIPIVNVFGFIQQTRELPDRRDLNRSFPGSARGSLAGRLAHFFMGEIVERCSHGIDLHTGSNHRTNLPQIRADLDNPETHACAQAFGATMMLNSKLRDGSLRQAAHERGAHVLLYEAGESQRFNEHAITVGTRGVRRVMQHLGMIRGKPSAQLPTRAFERSKWVRASRGGIMRCVVALGEEVTKGQVVAKIANTFGTGISEVKASATGLVIGFQQNPVVNQGDGVVHIALGDGTKKVARKTTKKTARK